MAAQPETVVIYGLHAVTARLNAGGGVRAIWALDSRRDQRLDAIIACAHAKGVPVERVARKFLDELAGTARHQGVVAHAAPSRIRSEADLKTMLAGLTRMPLLLVLDGVQDPRNLGACLRTAQGAAVDGVIVPKDRSAPLNPAARKTASGAAETMPIFQVVNLARVLRWLKRQGVWLAGAAGEAAHTLYETDLSGPLAIVMGAEGRGLRRLTREHCDFLMHIPLAETLESLNVAVAAGIVLFEARRQQHDLNQHD